jgi:peptide/nickel transport system substrate-binding protein
VLAGAIGFGCILSPIRSGGKNLPKFVKICLPFGCQNPIVAANIDFHECRARGGLCAGDEVLMASTDSSGCQGKRTKERNNARPARKALPNGRFLTMHLTRRDFLGGTAALTVGLAMGSPARAQSTDTIRMGMGAAQVATIDPIFLTQGVDNWAITHVFDLLARAPLGRYASSPDEFVPELAESWTISPNAEVWTFKIRQGAQFHKGYGECTAEDVKFSFDRVRDPKQGSGSAILYSNVAKVEAPDKYTVVITLKKPDPFFMSSLIHNTASNIVSKKAVEEKGEGFARDPIGTGPYQIVSVDPKNVKLTINDKYWGPKANIPNIEVQYILDTSARALAILGNQVDMILAPAGPGAINSITQKNPKLILDVALPGNSWSVAFNLNHKPFDNLKVRQAFMYAINKDDIRNSLTPATPRVFGLNPPSFPGALTDANCPKDLRYDYNPDKAKQLLAEAGFPNGFTFPAICSERDDYSSLMLILQEQLRQVGVTMDLKLEDHATFHSDALKDLCNFTMRGGSYAPVPTQAFANELAGPGNVQPDGKGHGNNFAHYGVAMPGIDDLLGQTMAEPDLTKRLALCQQIDTKILTDLPLISLCTTAFVVIRNPRLDIGFKLDSGLGYWRLNQAKFVA